MIDISHFRLRNIIDYKGETHYVSMLSLDIDDEYTDNIGVTPYGKTTGEKVDWINAFGEDIQPTILTEEWLIKFGFIKLHHFGNYEFTKLMTDPIEGEDKSPLSIEVIHRNDDNVYIVRLVLEPMTEYEASSINYHNLPHIKYIHQLQNLYYALTGEELKIK
jgi:hypothetical protein